MKITKALWFVLLLVTTMAIALGLLAISPVIASPRMTSTTSPSTLLVPAVVYVTADYHIHELSLVNGSWHDSDLTLAAGGAPLAYGSNIEALIRSDGISAVYYRGHDLNGYSHIYELRLQGGKWIYSDLTQISGGPSAYTGSNHFIIDAYVRGDGVTAVVFIGGTDHEHIFEYRLQGTWISSEITSIPTPPGAHGGVSAYVRNDNISTVIYTGGFNSSVNDIYEFRLENGSWIWVDLNIASANPDYPPMSFGTVYGYRRSDGISSIVYAPFSTHADDRWIYEIRLDSVGWEWSDLRELSSADPHGNLNARPYVRGDGTSAVVYPTSDYHLGEIRMDAVDGWTFADLSEFPNGQECVTPQGYVRADGVTAVVCRTPGYPYTEYYIYEVRLGESGWIWSNLTNIASAPQIMGPLTVYNRTWESNIMLPLVLKP